MEMLSDNAAGQLPGGLAAGGPRLTSLRTALLRLIGAIHWGATVLAAGVMLVELVIILCDVTQREFLSRSFLWSDETAKLSLSTIAFIGGAAAYRSRQHTSVRVLLDRMPQQAVGFVLAVLEWAVVVSASIAAVAGDPAAAEQLDDAHADPADQHELDRAAVADRHGPGRPVRARAAAAAAPAGYGDRRARLRGRGDRPGDRPRTPPTSSPRTTRWRWC